MGRIVVPRRSVLQGIGAAAGLAACGDPGRGGRGDTPGNPDARGATIDTIVICMMENRSFDHFFGSLSLLEGRTDVDGLLPGMSNPDHDGNEYAPVSGRPPCVWEDPTHSWDGSHKQFDGGTNRGFVKAHIDSFGPYGDPVTPMGFLTRDDVPVSYALADRYALCQRWFSSLMTSTWPNRIHFHAATSMGERSNDLPPGGRYSCRTIWDQLAEAGVDWAYYWSDLPTLALFGNPDHAGHVFVIDQFYADAAAGALPPVVCVDAAAGYNDDHPPHHPLLGQLFLGSIYNALAASPHWGRCLFLVTYDEAGGFFDHVPPGTVPDDDAADGFDQLGFRVPAFAAGPFVKNTVSDVQFDHSAALAFIQKRWGIDEPLNLRNEHSADLSVLLDEEAMAEDRPSDPIPLPVIERSEEEIEDECDGLGRRTGQPELRDVVRELWPSMDRTTALPRTARNLWRVAGEQGLWVPG